MRSKRLYLKYYSKFSHYHNQPGDDKSLSSNVVRSFLEDKKGNIWIATDGGGLNYFDREDETFKSYKHNSSDPSSPSSDAMLSLVEDNDGRLWIGTWGGGICILKNRDKMEFEKLHLENYPDTLTSNHFYLLKDKIGNIWSANYGVGLSVYDWKNKNFKTFFESQNESGPAGNFIISLCQDSEGNIWLGSDSFGITKMIRPKNGKEIFVKYLYKENDPTSLPGNNVNQIIEDNHKNIWAATGKGIAKYNKDNETFKTYTTLDGLPSNIILSIQEDDKGYLWLGTSNGLVKFDPVSHTFLNFNVNDGIQGKEFSRYSAKKLRTGELVFGGMNGFNIFHPDSLFSNPHRPPVYLTAFKIFNKKVGINEPNTPLKQHISITEHLTLSYTQNVFSFEFTSLNYTRSDQNMFAFKLEGLEEDWNYVGVQRNAAYSNLNPGEYVFRVKSSNNDGLWNEEGVSLRITVLPPWWKTWWAYVIWTVILAGLVFMIVLYRTSYLRSQKRYLEEQIKDDTIALEIKNEQISMQAEELLTFNEALNDINDVLKNVNENLEETVLTRTNELISKNKKLAEYAFINAHNLRVPVANIKGIIQLFEKDRTKEETKELIELIKGQSKKLDTVLLDIKNKLEKDDLIQD